MLRWCKCGVGSRYSVEGGNSVVRFSPCLCLGFAVFQIGRFEGRLKVEIEIEIGWGAEVGILLCDMLCIILRIWGEEKEGEERKNRSV